MDAKTITLKALVDKEKNKIIYVESEGDFVDVLWSFLTMPLGTIIRLIRNHPPITELGCLNNLHASVENLDARYLRTEACRTMLLYPQNAAADHCKNLKLQIDDTDSVRYFLCEVSNCKYKLLSHYKSASCHCGRRMNREEKLYGTVVSDATVSQLGFVYEVARFVISDELEVQPASSVFIFSLLAKHGVQDCSCLEERTFQIGADEVLNLLKFSWVSRTPLTDILLQQSTTREVSVEHIGQVGFVKRDATEDVLAQNDTKISVKLFISKSKRIVCYAEGGEDFVDLLFSFLTIPLGHVLKEPQGASSKGWLKNLYKSVQDLDAEKSLISEAKKDILHNLKLANWFGFSDHLLGLEEAGSKNLQYLWGSKIVPGYNYSGNQNVLTTDLSVLSTYQGPSTLSLMDPKLPYAEATNSGKGFARKPGMFTVTDDLKVTPISPSSGLSILMKLEVPYTDIEERIVLVGKEEALGLLVAAFNGSTCALTEVFLPKRQAESAKDLTFFFFFLAILFFVSYVIFQ